MTLVAPYSKFPSIIHITAFTTNFDVTYDLIHMKIQFPLHTSMSSFCKVDAESY